MVPGLCDVVPDVRVTPPGVQWPDLCSRLPSPPEPVCWLEFVGLVVFPPKMFQMSPVTWLSFRGAMFIDKGEVVVIAAI